MFTGSGPRKPRVGKLHAALAIAYAAAWPRPANASVTYSIENKSGWPSGSGANADSAMAALTADYNAYGDFGNPSFNFDLAYVNGVPTAQSTYLGQIQVGGSYSDELLRRVLEHETNHVLSWSLVPQHHSQTGIYLR